MLISVVTVPTTKPMMPSSMIRMSFTSFQRYLPRPQGMDQNVMISRMAGKMSATALLDKAPTSEMTRSRHGIMIAKTTEETDKENSR